jgi:hypothetical protein
VTFVYRPDVSGEPTIVDEERGIRVLWENGLDRRPERWEIGGTWRFQHADWQFPVSVEGEQHDTTSVIGQDGKLTETYGPSPRISLCTFAKPRRILRNVVPDDINQIIAEAMITAYSKGGRFPGRIEFRGPYGLKREYAPNN